MNDASGAELLPRGGGQVAGGRWQVDVRYIFLPGTFYENIKSAWESAKVNDTFCQTLFTKILKVLLNFDNKCPR